MKYCTTLSALLTLACSSLAIAHHGYAVHYDVETQVRIEGTIKEVLYRNPHSILRIAVPVDGAEDTIWTCETQAKSLLARKGITAERFPIGATIIVEGSKARRSEHGCEIGTMQLPDGELVTVRSNQGHANIAVNTAIPTMTPNSIFGSWIRDSFTGAPVRPGFLQSVSDIGRIANADYSGATDDPTRFCRPANPLRAMLAPGTPSEIRREDDRVIIQHEFMDTSRVITLGLSKKAPGEARTEMGYSTGRLEEDRLVVWTNNFAPGVLLTHVEDSGVLHSDQMTMQEVFSVDAETGNLIYEWEALDPLYFIGPIGGRLVLSPTMLGISSYDCEPQMDD